MSGEPDPALVERLFKEGLENGTISSENDFDEFISYWGLENSKVFQTRLRKIFQESVSVDDQNQPDPALVERLFKEGLENGTISNEDDFDDFISYWGLESSKVFQTRLRKIFQESIQNGQNLQNGGPSSGHKMTLRSRKGKDSSTQQLSKQQLKAKKRPINDPVQNPPNVGKKAKTVNNNGHPFVHHKMKLRRRKGRGQVPQNGSRGIKRTATETLQDKRKKQKVAGGEGRTGHNKQSNNGQSQNPDHDVDVQPSTSGQSQNRPDQDIEPQPSTSGTILPTRDESDHMSDIDSYDDSIPLLDGPEEEGKKYPYNFNPNKVTHNNKSFILKQIRQRRYKKYVGIDTTFRVRFKEEWMGENLVDILDNMYHLFSQLILRAKLKTPKAEGGRFIRIIIKHSDIKAPIVVPIMDLEKIDAGLVLERIQSTLNSNESLAIDNSFSVVIGTVRKLEGKGRLHPTSMVNIARKRSIKTIDNDDSVCFQRAVAVGWVHSIRVKKDEWESITAKFPKNMSRIEIVSKVRKCSNSYYADVLREDRDEQLKVATMISQWAGVPMDRPGGLLDIPKYESVLDRHISVISRETGNKFVTPAKEGKPKIYLYHVGNHFNTILSTTGFFRSSYFCEDCRQPFSDFKNHTCHTCCRVCHSIDCKLEKYIDCGDCHMTCRSEQCFKRHRAVVNKVKNGSKKSLCSRYWKCLECKKILQSEKRSQKDHFCSERLCFSCKEYVNYNHRCYMMSLPVTEFKLRMLVFDFETRQDEGFECEFGYEPKNSTGENCKTCSESTDRCASCTSCINCHDSNCGSYKHTPNLVVSQTICDLCSTDLDTNYETKCPGCGSRCEKCSRMKEGEFERDPCPGTCGHRVKVFEGDDCATNFCNWLFQDYHKDIICASHYGKGFDNIFILSYLLENAMPPESVVYSGSKIMAMSVQRGMNIRFVDTFNFFSLRLAVLPDAFGFDEVCKGYFAHFFNVLANQNYIGPYPPKEDFGHEYMSVKGKKNFEKWYDEVKDDVFDFREEIVKYCKMDTDILLKAVYHFREIIMSIVNIDPFKYYTLPSLCMAIFRTKFLEEQWTADILDSQGKVAMVNQTVKYKGGTYKLNGEVVQEACVKKKKFKRSNIAHVPATGYATKDQYSLESICYLEWLSMKRQVKIQHALNGGEKKIKIGRSFYRADGFIPDPTLKGQGRVIEYMGCSWHGCRFCYRSNRDTTKLSYSQETIEDRYRATMKKKEDLIVHGYEYECFWACQFKKKMESDSEFNSFVNNLVKSKDLSSRIDIRESFLGGRVDSSKLYYEVREDEKIHYYDVTSLYPYVNKYCEYPVGHPEIITENFKSIDNYFGIAKVRVLPPEALYHPVLPMKANGKLKFPLCAKCAVEEYKFLCTCTNEEREMVGVWTTLEIKKAIEKGYKLLKIYEVYHWEETSVYDPDKNQTGLFSEYVNMFFKLKQQAKGWPEECKNNEEKKDEFIDKFFQHEKIKLDKDKIKNNPSLYTTSKMALNGFWGKFAQRLNLKQTRFFNDDECDKFFQTLTDPSKEVSNFHIINDKVIQLEYNNKDEFVPECASANIFIGIFTTSHARLILYKILDFLDGGVESTPPPPTTGPIQNKSASKDLTYPTRVLYYDTDSVIFVSKKGDKNPPLGNFLGDLTDECPGTDIVKFISAGPKVYAYRTSDGDEVCKIRGFTLNYANKKVINMDNLEKIILNWNSHVNPLVTVNPKTLKRDKPTCSIVTKKEQKNFKMVYTKRIIKANYDTVPYGYRGLRH